MLKKENCTMDLVVGLDAKTLPVKLGIIVGPVTINPTAGEMVVVEWEGGYIQKVTLRSLITGDEANKLQVELQATKDKLEYEFQLVAQQVAEKLEAAAKLIEEAGTIATKSDKNLTSDFYQETLQVEAAMEKAGWNTSSWYC